MGLFGSFGALRGLLALRDLWVFSVALCGLFWGLVRLLRPLFFGGSFSGLFVHFGDTLGVLRRFLELCGAISDACRYALLFVFLLAELSSFNCETIAD